MKINILTRYISSVSFLTCLTLAVMALGVPRKAAATQAIQVAVVTCSSCQSPSDLLGTATSYFSQWDGQTPPGYVGTIQDLGDCANLPPTVTTAPTVVMVVSTAIAITDSYYACWIYPHGGPAGVLRTYSFTGGTFSSAIAEDEQLFSRALINSGRVTLPPNYAFNGEGGSSPDVVIEGWLSGDASAGTGSPFQLIGGGFNPWHGLDEQGVPQVQYQEFLNTQNGQTFTVYNGDTIKVYDSNGWSATFQFNPSLPDLKWQIVPGSIRDQNGNPVGTTSLIPGGIQQPIGAIDVGLPPVWADPDYYIIPWYNNSTPNGGITVGPFLNGKWWVYTVNVETP